MLRTVQFHHKFGIVTVKIGDIAANNLLSAKSWTAQPKKIIPKVAFFLCHFPSELPRERQQVLISGLLHIASFG